MLGYYLIDASKKPAKSSSNSNVKSIKKDSSA
jgi:hypothetical protein